MERVRTTSRSRARKSNSRTRCCPARSAHPTATSARAARSTDPCFQRAHSTRSQRARPSRGEREAACPSTRHYEPARAPVKHVVSALRCSRDCARSRSRRKAKRRSTSCSSSPEIPPNTGNIARLVRGHGVAAASRRAARVSHRRAQRAARGGRLLASRRRPHARRLRAFPPRVRSESPARQASSLQRASPRRATSTPAYAPGDALVFGKESVGLPEELLARYPDRVVGIPTLGAVRSLNLANAVGIVALRGAPRDGRARTTTFEG